MNLWKALWHDEAGFVISAELVLISTVAVLGLVVGLTCVRDAVVGEMKDVADAFRSVRQDYSYSGMHGCSDPCRHGDCYFYYPHSWTAGSCFSEELGSACVDFDCIDCQRPAECHNCPQPAPLHQPAPPHRQPEHRQGPPVNGHRPHELPPANCCGDDQHLPPPPGRMNPGPDMHREGPPHPDHRPPHHNDHRPPHPNDRRSEVEPTPADAFETPAVTAASGA